MVLALPRLVGTAAASLQEQAALLGEQFGDGDVAGVLVRVLSIVAIALPVLGVVYILGRVVRQSVARTWQSTRAVRVAEPWPVSSPSPWWPGWRGPGGPIRARTARSRRTSGAPCRMRCRRDCAAPRPAGCPKAGSARRGRSGPRAPSCPPRMRPPWRSSWSRARRRPRSRPRRRPVRGPWLRASRTDLGVPVRPPAAPGEGDNQALAVNTTDGGTLYDVAFALVYADEDTVLNTNEAYALASCTGCQTVAVAFQVVLVLGEANVVVPQNLSAAVNYACVQCVTYALATQLVLTVSGPLGADTTAWLAQLWKELEAFGRSIKDLPSRSCRHGSPSSRRRSWRSSADPAFVPAASVPTSTATTTAPASGSGATASPTSTDTPDGLRPSRRPPRRRLPRPRPPPRRSRHRPRPRPRRRPP